MTTPNNIYAAADSVLRVISKRLLIIATASTLLVGASAVNAQGLDINQILSTANNAAAKDRRANTARENRFKAERSKQQGRLNSMKNERARQERISDDLDRQFKANDEAINKLQDDLAKELGDLKQLFGVIQLSASEAQESYKTSLISAQYPTRSEDLRQMVAKMASLTELVSIDEIEELWFELQNEMTEQGKVVQYTKPAKFKTGQQESEDGKLVDVFEERDSQITRVGVFSGSG